MTFETKKSSTPPIAHAMPQSHSSIPTKGDAASPSPPIDSQTPATTLWKLGGITYDLSTFVEQHPGGEIAIKLAQGLEDSTNLFNSYHLKNSRARKVLEEYRVDVDVDVDVVIEGEKAERNGGGVKHPGAFKEEVDEMLVEHFKAKGLTFHDGRVSTYQHNMMGWGFVAVTLVLWYYYIKGSLIATFLLPQFSFLFMVTHSHDATHFCISRNSIINEVVAYSALPWFYSPLTWYDQHVIHHHTETNSIKNDPDLQHFALMKLHQKDKAFTPWGHTL